MDASDTQRYCSHCKTYRPVSFFTSTTRSAPFRTCSICRYRQTPVLIDQNLIVDTEQFLQSYPAVETVELDGMEHRSVTYKYKGYVRCEELADLVENDAADNAEAYKCIANQYIALVESCDGYGYYIKNIGVPKRQSKVSFSAYCIQDARIQAQETEENTRKRKCRRMTTYECNGVIHGTIDLTNKCVHLDIDHNNIEHHPLPR